ncbi:class I SAM-dependent methyltransferase [Sphingomonas sp.]|uniref:class I SAM-dependent methyltransferase n=1 Tax=Sphingomonas sp. TaxID=28214 RepID=UPI0025F04360|nr:class I SAM-dependent methyltransferase [Sphingomonas sp.]MBV9528793.1 class I SAM-dependent methyltransferase [Sphingomonas sp.]
MSLWESFQGNTGRTIHKWKHYFPAYERHFARFVNQPITFLEIGVGQGGSLQMWKRYFGPHARIVGIDIQPGCKAFEEDQIEIRIGSQGDPQFLAALVAEFGPFDVILDDGSHRMDDVNASFAFLYPRMGKAGVYMVEDLHTAYDAGHGGGLRREGSFIETCKRLIDELNADWINPAELPGTDFTRNTLSMHFYDSIAVFERGAVGKKFAPMIPPPSS